MAARRVTGAARATARSPWRPAPWCRSRRQPSRRPRPAVAAPVRAPTARSRRSRRSTPRSTARAGRAELLGLAPPLFLGGTDPQVERLDRDRVVALAAGGPLP